MGSSTIGFHHLFLGCPKGHGNSLYCLGGLIVLEFLLAMWLAFALPWQMLERLREAWRAPPLWSQLIFSSHGWLTAPLQALHEPASWLQVPMVEQNCPHHDMQEAERGRREGATASYHPQGDTPSDLSLDTDTWVTYPSGLSWPTGQLCLLSSLAFITYLFTYPSISENSLLFHLYLLFIKF